MLLLSNDAWISRMSGVAAVIVRSAGQPQAPRGVALPGIGWADPHWLVHVKKAALDRALAVAAAASISQIEDDLVELLALSDLHSTPSDAPVSPAGTIGYPRWGDIYWVGGFATGGQTKRYVVASHDHYNASAGARPFLVRTTSQPKRNAQEFPSIQDGVARACCGDIQTSSVGAVEQARRPSPRSLSLLDMQAVARGLASVLELEAAVIRGGGVL